MIEIRDAKASDLPSVYRVFLEDELKNEAVLPSISQVPMFLTHELRSGHMVVCEEEGEIAGFATTITRGEVVYLAELFMRSDRQSGGVGKLLLQRVLQGATNGVCTLGSTDPRAMALYIRAGMRPLWPNLWLRRELTTGTTPVLENLGVVVEQAIVNDPELIEWDREASKRFRPMDHRYWIETNAIPFWFVRNHERIGYGYLQTRNESAIWSQDAVTIGPLGAKSPEDAATCLIAAVDEASQRSHIVRVAVPGPHLGLKPLLDAGFRITYVETFMESRNFMIDPRLYIGSGDFF